MEPTETPRSPGFQHQHLRKNALLLVFALEAVALVLFLAIFFRTSEGDSGWGQTILFFSGWCVLTCGAQCLFLLPVFPPRAKQGSGTSPRIWISAAIGGLIAGILAMGVPAMVIDFLWNGPDGDVVAGLLLVGVLVSWGVFTPLLAAFMRRGPIETRLARLAARLFLGTVIELIATIPVLQMLDRRQRCVSETFSFLALLFTIAFGLVLFGPMILLVGLARRTRAANRGFCAACGADLRGLEDRTACPGCGCGWKRR